MKRALIFLIVALSFGALGGCDQAPADGEETAAGEVVLPYARIAEGGDDPAENGPDDSTVLAEIAPGTQQAVKFPHFKHASNQKSGFGIPCVDCHHTAEGTDPDDGCVSCHKVPAKDAEAAHQGPDDNLLLIAEKQDLSETAPVPFNHFTHASAKGYKVTCESCHHTGDKVPCSDCHLEIAKKTEDGAVVPKTKRAFHLKCKGCHENLKKSQPDSIAPVDCESCHTTNTLKRLPGSLSLERALHLSCVTCHQRMQLANPETKAPAQECAGCHNGGKKKKKVVKRPTPKPSDDGKPKVAAGQEQDPGPAKMIIDHAIDKKSGSPFDHHAHQTYGDSCEACHHKGLEDPTCRTCHKTVEDAKKIYHANCMGCHKERGAPNKCTTCHPK